MFPPGLTAVQMAYTYANEADMLNVVLFGKTAKQWKDVNPMEKGNMRDAATLNQLLVLTNLESYNAVLITQGKNQKERMKLLRQLTVQHLQRLETVGLKNCRNEKVIRIRMDRMFENNGKLFFDMDKGEG